MTRATKLCCDIRFDFSKREALILFISFASDGVDRGVFELRAGPAISNFMFTTTALDEGISFIMMA
jgi:hypothetical protein